MAEALINHSASDSWTALSAGTEPAGFVHPKALQVLEEINIFHTGRSKSLDDFRGQEFDLVVTVCDQAQDKCPVWLGSGAKIHWAFTDPATANGTDEEILVEFRKVRDQIQAAIPAILSQLKEKD